MKCGHCNHVYPVAITQAYQGVISGFGVFTALVFGIMFYAHLGWGWIVLAGCVLVFLEVLLVWGIGYLGLIKTGGETCPKCAGKNRVFPWSR